MAGQRQVNILDIRLNTSEVADLAGVSIRHVRRLAQEAKLSYTMGKNERNRPEYLFPLSSLPTDIQRRWYAQHGEKAETTELLTATDQGATDKPGAVRKTPGKKPLDEYTVVEREQIAFWMNTVAEWREFRQGGGQSCGSG